MPTAEQFRPDLDKKRKKNRAARGKAKRTPTEIGVRVPRTKAGWKAKAKAQRRAQTRRARANYVRDTGKRTTLRKARRSLSYLREQDRKDRPAPPSLTVTDEGRASIPASDRAGDIASKDPLVSALRNAPRTPSDAEFAFELLSALPPIRAARAASTVGKVAHAVIAGEKAASKAGKSAPKLAKATRATPKPNVKPKATTTAKPKIRPTTKPPKKMRRARRVAGTTGRAAGKTVRVGTAPIRHPLKVGAPLALAPSLPESVRTGSFNPVQEALEGAGKAQELAASAGETVAKAAPGDVLDNLIRDVVELPTQIVPSLYLVGDAALSAAKGDDTKAKEMIDAYVKGPINPETGEREAPGFLPAVLQGDPGLALEAIKAHPLYSALEVSGAYAGAGRTAGAVTRRVPKVGKKIAGTQRKARRVYGDISEPRRYSANLITKGAQVAREKNQRRRGIDPDEATPKQRKRYLRHRTDFGVAMQEGQRRAHQEAVKGILPPSVRDRIRRKGAPKKAEGVVALVAQRVVRSRDTYKDDLDAYAKQLDRAYVSGKLTRSEKKANRALAEQARAGLKLSPKRVEAVFAAAKRYETEDARLRAELVEGGMLAPDQAAKAAAIPFATIHLGATHGKPKPKGKEEGPDIVYHATTKENAAKIRREGLRGTSRFGGQVWVARTPELARHGADSRGAFGQEVVALRDTRGGLRGSDWATGPAERFVPLRAESRERQLLDREGNPLSLKQIEAEMTRQGIEVPAFLTHRPGSRGPGSFYQPYATGRGSMRTGKRTGEATKRGTFDASLEALTEQLARSQTVADRAAAYDAISAEFGLRKPDGSYFKDRDEAEAAIRDPEDHGVSLPEGTEFVPWRITPFPTKGTERVAAQERGAGAKLEALDPDVQQEGALHNLIEGSDTGAGNYVLIPRQVRKRLLDHAKPRGDFEKGFQALTTGFKSAVLPTSPKWVTGNAVEASIRMLVNGQGVFDWSLGKRMLAKLKEVDPEAAARLEGAALGGQLMGSQRRLDVHRNAKQFEDTAIEPLAKALAKVRATRGPGSIVNAYRVYRDTVYKLNAQFIERTPQFAALGKEGRRQLQETTGRWHHALAVGDDALLDLAKGLRNTDKQIQYARAVEQVVGQWHRWEPSFRFAMTSYAPFLSWARAATRFVALTLPRHHPIFTGLAAVATEVTQEEREALGLSHFAREPVPPWLQGSIPLANGGLLPVSNVSSFGSFADYPDFLSNLVLPQFSSGLEALGGMTWTGDKLTDAEGRPLSPLARILPSIYIQAEAMMPFLSLARRLREQGGTSEPGSTVFSPKAGEGEGVGSAVKRWALLRPYPKKIVDYLRSLSQSREITIPVKGAGYDPPEKLEDATVDNLQAIPGIGEVTAAAIIKYRDANPGTEVVDLDRVDGIGPATMEELGGAFGESYDPDTGGGGGLFKDSGYGGTSGGPAWKRDSGYGSGSIFK